MIFLELFLSFFKIGLFAVGGGLATVPFLFELSETTHWFSVSELVKMIAVSESTPGPLGINMATYCGVHVAGVFGGLVATLGIVSPMLLVVGILSHYYRKLRKNRWVKALFLGLRPAVAMMIFGFVLRLIWVIFDHALDSEIGFLSFVLFFFYVWLTFKYKWHPVVFIALAGLIGLVQGLLV